MSDNTIVWRRITPAMTAAQQAQLAVLRAEIGDVEEPGLIECYELDDAGTHVFDAVIFCGDDGFVFRRGTTELVASWSRAGRRAAWQSCARRLLGACRARRLGGARRGSSRCDGAGARRDPRR